MKNNQKKQMFLIKLPYWLGIGADALWAIALVFPSVYALLAGRADFRPDLEVRLIMGIGASLMAGWTVLLIWAVRKPVERRFVILLTSCVILCLFVVAFIGFLNGNSSSIWILIKTLFLIIVMVNSYILSVKTEQQKKMRG